jgi:hypothetical protein
MNESALSGTSASSRPMVVMITVDDVSLATGSDVHVQCLTTTDLVSSDVLVVDLRNLREVIAEVCPSGPLPSAPPDSRLHRGVADP